MLKVRDLMTEEVKSVSPGDVLTEAYDILEDLHVRHVPVIDHDGDVVGLVTHRDLAQSVLHVLDSLPQSDRRIALQMTKVDEVMIRDPETIGPDASVIEAATLLLEHKFGCLPVTENGRLMGIITESDFVKHVRDSG
jgi:CBS domain-containing membrane protein